MRKRINWNKLVKLIPNKIDLPDGEYEILWVDKFKNGNHLGEFRADTKQIIILNGLSSRQTVMTYLHEVIHAFSDTIGLGMTESRVFLLEKNLYWLLKPGNILKRK